MKLVQFIHSRNLYDYDEDISLAAPICNPTPEYINELSYMFEQRLNQRVVSWYGILTYEVDHETGVSELISYTQKKGTLNERIILNKDASPSMKTTKKNKYAAPQYGQIPMPNDPFNAAQVAAVLGEFN